MPAKKRTLQEADANANANASAPAPKNQKRAADQENQPEEENTESAWEDESPETPEDPNKDRSPDDWICMDQPFWDFEYAATHKTDASGEDVSDDEAYEDEDDEDEEESALYQRYQKEVVDTKIWGEPASQRPEHKWRIVWDAWQQLCEMRVQEDYCNPDNFDMHVYSRFESYGIVALIELRLKEFNKEYTKKASVALPDPASVRHRWAVLGALGHWLQLDKTMVLMKAIHIDDAARANDLIALAGCAFLTGLDSVDRIGWLKPDSEIMDLGLVMAIWLDWSRTLDGYGIDETNWRKDIVAYAKKGGIDLQKEGCSGIGRSLKEFEDIGALKGQPKAGRWKWPKTFKEYKTNYGIGYDTYIPYNLPGYDITKWPRFLRKKFSFDGKDPLADFPEKDLQEGKIMLR